MTTVQGQDLEHQHLAWEAVDAFLYRTETPEERRVLYHLLTQCAGCREGSQPLLELRRSGVIHDSTSPLEIELAVSEHRAPDLWRELEEGPLSGADDLDEKVRRLRDDPRWPTWGLVAWLARRSLETARVDAAEAIDWGDLAAAAAARLPDDDPAPAEWSSELRAFALAALGNALRVAGDREDAEEAFDSARDALDAHEEPADFLPFRAQVLTLEAALRRDQRRFPDALELLDRAWDAWDTVVLAPPELRARVPWEGGRICETLGDLEGASASYYRTLELLESGADPAFRLAVERRYLEVLVRLGRMEDAADRVPAVHDLLEAVGTPVDRLWVTWVEAAIHEILEEDPDLAETLLREVMDGFCERKMPYEGALAALDLARLLLTQGCPGEVRELTLRVKPIFEALEPSSEVHEAIRSHLDRRVGDEAAVRGTLLLAPALLALPGLEVTR